MDQVEFVDSINLHERNPFECCLFNTYFSNLQINASISAKYDSKVNCCIFQATFGAINGAKKSFKLSTLANNLLWQFAIWEEIPLC